jgi:hypothetical protein
MFGWIARRRANRRRQIFRYFDSTAWRQCDPIETLMRIQSHPKYDYHLHPQMVDDGDREAIEITVDAVRSAFGVVPFDASTGIGMTVSETLELLSAFCVYLDVLKKSTRTTVTSLLPTAPTSSGSGETITSGTSAIGSIATVQNLDMPTDFAAR